MRAILEVARYRLADRLVQRLDEWGNERRLVLQDKEMSRARSAAQCSGNLVRDLRTLTLRTVHVQESRGLSGRRLGDVGRLGQVDLFFVRREAAGVKGRCEFQNVAGVPIAAPEPRGLTADIEADRRP